MQQYNINNPTNGTTRFSDDAMTAFNQIEGFDNAEKILQTIARFVGTHTKEIYRPIKFSEDTGKPTDFNWVPGSTWDGRVWIGYGMNGVNVSNDVFAVMKKAGVVGIEKPTIFCSDNKSYSVRYVRSWDSGGVQGGLIPHHFLFEEANTIDFAVK